MFELSALKFAVDTAELKSAIGMVDQLATSVNRLSKPLKATSDAAKEAGKSVEQATVASTKATTASTAATTKQVKQTDTMLSAIKLYYKQQEQLAKAEQKQKEQMFRAGDSMNNEAVKAYHKFLDAQTVAQRKAVDSRVREMERETKALGAEAKKQQSILERQQAEAKFMARGSSRGEASVLARAEARGEEADIPQIIRAQQTKRSFSGGDTFDKTISGLRNMNQELGQSREGYRQMIAYQKEYLKLQLEGQGKEASLMALNKKETDNLYRDKLRLLEVYKQTKSAAIDSHDPDFVNKVKAQKTALTDLKNSLREVETGYNKVAQIKRPLENIRTIDSTKRRNQLDYMARATSVQLGDIGVSLAGGQNPLTVMLMQGDQLRAILGGVGKDTKAMQEVMNTAFTQMITGMVTVGQALTSLVGGAFKTVGLSIVDAGMKLTGFNFLMDKARLGLERLDYNFGTNLTRGFDKAVASAGGFGTLVRTLAGIGFGAAIAGALGVALAYKEIIQTSQDLSVALAMSGGAIAINKDEALKMSAALASTSGTSMQVVGVITEIAKAGNLSKDSIAGITKASLDLEKYGGIAVKDTVALYAKLADDPVKGLTELALKTGDVSQATLDHIGKLVAQGDSVNAVTLAIEEMNRVNGLASQQMLADMSPLEVLWSEMKGQLTSLKEEFYAIAGSSELVNVFATAWRTVSVIISEVWFVIKGVGKEIGGLAAQLGALASGDFKGASNIRGMMVEDAKAARTAQDALTKSIVEGTSSRSSAEKQYINVMQAGAIVRREMTEADKTQNIAGIKAGEALKKEAEKYNNVSNLDGAGREKAKQAAIDKVRKLALESMKAHGADVVAIEKKQAETIANINEQYKPKKEPKAKKVQKTEAEKELESSIKFMDDMLDKSSGKLPTFTEDMKKLGVAMASGKYTQDQYNAAFSAYMAKQPEAIEAARIQKEITKQNEDAFNDLIKEINNASDALDKLNKSYAAKTEDALFDNAGQAKDLEFREALIGKTQEQQQVMRITFEEESRLRKINQQELKDLKEAQEKYNEAVKNTPSMQAQADRLKADAEAGIKLVADGQRELAANATKIGLKELENAKLDKFAEGLSDALVTGLTKGAKEGRKKLRDLIVAELEKTITLSITANIKGLLGGGSGGGLLDSLFGKASDSFLSKGLDFLGGMFGGGSSIGAFGASSTFGAATGTVGLGGMSAATGTGAAALAELSTGIGALGTSATATAAAATSTAVATGGMGTAILGALGPIGLFAAGATALFAIFGFGKDKIPTVLNDLALFNNSLIGLPFLELAVGSDEAAQGLRDVLYGLDNATPTMKKLAGETVSLSIELLRATGDIAGAVNLARNLGTRGMSEAEIAVYDYNQGLRNQIEAARAGASAAQAAANAEEQLAKTRWDLAGKLNILLGRTTQKEFDRATQLAATSDAASLSMLNLIFQMEDLHSAVDAAYGVLERSIAAERKLAEARLKDATDLQALLKSSKDANTLAVSRKAAQAQLSTFLAIAKSSGFLPSAEALKPLLDSIGKPSEDLFSTFEEYQKDFLRTARNISEMSGLADKQVSMEQQTIDALDAQLETAKAQLDALKGVDNSVKDVKTAVNDFNAAMQALAAAQKNTATTTMPAPTGSGGGGYGGYGGGGGSSTASNPFEDIAGQENKDIVDAYREYYNRNPDPSGYKHFVESTLKGDKLSQAILRASAADPNGPDYKMAVSRGYNPLDPIAKFFKLKSTSSNNTTSDVIDPSASFAVGINNVPYDMTAQIHKGERILPAADNAELFARLATPERNAEVLAAAVERLTREVEGLRSESRQIAVNTRKTTDALTNATNENGQAFNVVVEET